MIIGIDPSISNLGIAALTNNGQTIAILKEIRTSSKKPTSERLRTIRDELVKTFDEIEHIEAIELIVIEQPYIYVRTEQKKTAFGKRDVKPVTSIIKLCFAFGAIFGTCVSMFPDSKIETQIALHKEGRRWVGLVTKQPAANRLHAIFGDELTRFGKVSDNCTDALYLAWDRWERNKGRILEIK